MKPFSMAIKKAEEAVRTRSIVVHPSRWQSIDVSQLPEAATHEVLNHTLTAAVTTEDLTELADDIKPNMPWADDHFLERVGEAPLNPGVQWAKWPYAHSAEKFLTAPGKKFSHTYMERYWPKHAGGPDEDNIVKQDLCGQVGIGNVHQGIRYGYGDVLDVVDHLADQPLSRQAYLPIWFPEDTGKTDVRVPCTLGYHFIMRGGFFHCTYYIRSCDLLRHFRDDIYLTVRLQLWMLQRLRKHEVWASVKPGLLTMHIVSLHLFRNDYIKLFGGPK